MSDLTGKFGTFEGDIAANHAEIMTALGAITTALGVPPSGTFTELLTAIGQTNTLLTASNYILTTKLTDIFDLLDTMNNNASLNAQRILMLLLQSFCPCDTEAPLLPVPVDDTPTVLTSVVKCQRIQYFIDMFVSWAITCGVYVDMHGSISSFQIKNLLDIAIGEVSLPDSQLSHMSTSTRDNLSTLLNTADTPTNINATIFGALTNSVVITAMRQSLYSADNASDGKTAVDTAIGANVFGNANIIVAMFYSSWLNVIYSESPIIDASAYDGSICAPYEPPFDCTSIDSQVIGVTGYGSRNAIAWPAPFPSSNADEISNTYSANQVLIGNYQYCIFRLVSGPGARLLYFNTGAYSAVNIYVGTPLTIPTVTTSVWIDDLLFNTPFTVEICPPEPS